MANYQIEQGSIHEKFLKSRAKIQLFGGGFANGKTTSACVKAIQIAKDYPGANILVARATMRKLADSIGKEFYKWLPPDWIKSSTKSGTEGMTTHLKNGSIINFRYVQQQSRGGTTSSSNLLSATYDLAVIDQIDDPEFHYKDLIDTLGRLRGRTKYAGEDKTMPATGPRWLILTCNPTRNWLYRQIVAPYHEFIKTGRVPRHLYDILTKANAKTVQEMLEIFEGSTHTNAMNLPEDYFQTNAGFFSETYYKRYILGEWGAFEGLVYPDFDHQIHCVPEEFIFHWMQNSDVIQLVEGFDYGATSPSCYLLGLRDSDNNVVIIDGFYERNLSIHGEDGGIEKIKAIRKHWNIPGSPTIRADPSILVRSKGARTRTVGATVAELYYNNGLGIAMHGGNNDIKSGIAKISAYLRPTPSHPDPFRKQLGAPKLFFNDKLEFIADEITDYYWEEDETGERTDKPKDRNDHSLDTLRYLMTDVPMPSALIKRPKRDMSFLTKWHEPEDVAPPTAASVRYG